MKKGFQRNKKQEIDKCQENSGDEVKNLHYCSQEQRSEFFH